MTNLTGKFSNLAARTALALALALGVFAASGTARAEDAASGSSWTATTHMGFAVVDRSTTGMEDVTGSLVLLDVTRRVAPTVDLGFRSAAQGGKRPGKEYYRLAAGPVVSWRFAERWVAQLALGAFEESGLDGSGEPSYESRGHTLTLNWQRTLPLGKRAELACGGFVMRHQGDVALPDRETGAAAAVQLGTAANVGLTHGALAAFRVRL